MSVDKRWKREEAERVSDHLAESIETESASEIAAELKDSGHDVSDIAARMKAAALAGVKGFRQQRLHRARQRYDESSSRIERHSRTVGGSREERRRRFFRVLEEKPELRSRYTMQHRDLDALTDTDIDSALEELEILGALEDSDDSHS
jgi:GrpB-like predicted nucleotidyltransferase (UPF0157 family)